MLLRPPRATNPGTFVLMAPDGRVHDPTSLSNLAQLLTLGFVPSAVIEWLVPGEAPAPPPWRTSRPRRQRPARQQPGGR